MKEQELRQIMSRIGVRLSRPTSKGWMNASCPLAPWKHKSGIDKHASFAVLINEQDVSLYTCLGCKSKGRISQLVREIAVLRQDPELLKFADTVESDEVTGLVIPDFDTPVHVDAKPEPLDEAMWDGMFDRLDEHPKALEYLKARGISRDTADALDLEFDPDQGRILFPVRGANNELWGFTGRAISPKTQPKVKDYAGLPKRHLILGRNRWVEGKPVLLVEGLFAYATMVEIGADEMFNIGAALGSELTPEKAHVLKEFGHGVFLLFDPDEAGDAGLFGRKDPQTGEVDYWSGAISKLIDEVPVFVPAYPEGITDPDDLSYEHVETMRMHTPIYDATQWARPQKKDW